MQVIWINPPTGTEYVTQRAWEHATLDCCPFHAEGACGLQSLGSYPRVWPAGARVARFWCPEQGTSISLLPDFLAARFTGALDAIEDVVDAVEQAGSIASAIETLHPAEAQDAIGLIAAHRSIQRRLRPIRAALLACVTLLAELHGCAPTLAEIRSRLGEDRVLVQLRRRVASRLGALLAPFGFRPRGTG